MSKVALVTGGTRGIGESISRGLKDAGYTVAATYAGNTEKAEAFKAETGMTPTEYRAERLADFEKSMPKPE